jgi:hypothetical protein
LLLATQTAQAQTSAPTQSADFNTLLNNLTNQSQSVAPCRPYACRRYDDEQKKCAFGSCDKRVIEQLKKDCLIEGGIP